MLRTAKLTLFSALMFSVVCSVPSSAQTKNLRARSVFPCTEKENWKFKSSAHTDLEYVFMNYLDDPFEISKVYRLSFSNMEASNQSTAKLFGHYWVARALFEENLFHLAFERFKKILSVPIKRDIIGIQMAALACTAQIQNHQSSFRLPWRLILKLKQGLIENARIKLYKNERRNLENSVLKWVRNYVGTKVEVNELASLMPLIKKGSKKRFLVRALISVKRRKYSEAARDLWKVLNLAQSQRESGVASELIVISDEYFLEVLRLTRARVLFESGQLKKAVVELKKMEKTSSEFMHALQQQAWVYLVQGNYRDAIGMALSLHSTGFENTFTPAALMVVAMSFNELCQYPSAQRVLKRFGNQYGRIYKWMRERRKSNEQAPYDFVAQYLKGKNSKIPKVVLSEWLRSQVFISKQEELNLLFSEKAVLNSLKEERKRGLLAFRRANFIIKRLKERISKYQRSTSSIANKRKKLYNRINFYKGEKKGIISFKNDMIKLQRSLPKKAKLLVEDINEDLGMREKRMMLRIGALFEIAQLLQVELLEGAGEDIVWRNVHKDYTDFSLDDREFQMKKMQRTGFKWGDGPEVTDGLEEVWEDELGNLQANVANRCITKDKYLTKIGGK